MYSITFIWIKIVKNSWFFFLFILIVLHCLTIWSIDMNLNVLFLWIRKIKCVTWWFSFKICMLLVDFFLMFCLWIQNIITQLFSILVILFHLQYQKLSDFSTLCHYLCHSYFILVLHNLNQLNKSEIMVIGKSHAKKEWKTTKIQTRRGWKQFV